MKTCQTIERILLLSASGEGPSPLPRHVQAHLQQCAACRTYQAELDRLSRAVHAVHPVPPVPQETHMALRAAARRQKERRRRTTAASPIPFWPAWRPALAVAAALALLLAAGLVLRSISSQEKASIGHEDARLAEAHLLGDEEIALLGLVLLSWENDIDFFMSMLFDGSDDPGEMELQLLLWNDLAG